MQPTKGRVADIKGHSYSVRWNMNALFLFAEYADIKTVEECERVINKALLDIKSASDTTLKGTPIDSIKIIVKMVRASIDGHVGEKDLTELLGAGELDSVLKETVEAYVDNLPDYEAGITQEAPKAVKKKNFRLVGCLRLVQKWVGSLRSFGKRLWASLFTAGKDTTQPKSENGNTRG